ncbi:MAG: hypothetical protein ACLTT1_17340 [[Clostridium] scindens]
MVGITFAELTIALVLITELLLSREAMKGREQGRIYRERLFQNISANIDFAFLVYAPAKQSVEMVSDNVGLPATMMSLGRWQPGRIFCLIIVECLDRIRKERHSLKAR